MMAVCTVQLSPTNRVHIHAGSASLTWRWTEVGWELHFERPLDNLLGFAHAPPHAELVTSSACPALR
jgi:hypothetical protein